MTIQVRQGGAWQTITGAKIFANGAWRTVLAGKIYASGAWRDICNFVTPPPGGGGGGGGTIVLTISPSPFSRITAQHTISNTLTATPSGGLAPYTYSWTVVTSTTTFTIGSPTLATTAVTATLADNATETCTLRCTVTDSLGSTTHADVNGTFENATLGGP